MSIRTAELKSDMSSIPMYAKYYFESFIIVFVIIVIYFGNLNERSIEANISYFAILAFAAQKCLPLINGIYKSSIAFKGGVPMVFDRIFSPPRQNLLHLRPFAPDFTVHSAVS